MNDDVQAERNRCRYLADRLLTEMTASAEAMSKQGFHDNAYWGVANRARELIEQIVEPCEGRKD